MYRRGKNKEKNTYAAAAASTASAVALAAGAAVAGAGCHFLFFGKVTWGGGMERMFLFNGFLSVCVCGWFDKVDGMEKKRKEEEEEEVERLGLSFIDGNNKLNG